MVGALGVAGCQVPHRVSTEWQSDKWYYTTTQLRVAANCTNLWDSGHTYIANNFSSTYSAPLFNHQYMDGMQSIAKDQPLKLRIKPVKKSLGKLCLYHSQYSWEDDVT